MWVSGQFFFYQDILHKNKTNTYLNISMQSVDKVSDIDKKVSQIDNMRSMIASLLQSIDKILETDKKSSSN